MSYYGSRYYEGEEGDKLFASEGAKRHEMPILYMPPGGAVTSAAGPGAGGPGDPRDLEREVLEEFRKRGREALVTAAVAVPSGIVGGVAGGLAGGAVGGVAGIATGNKDVGKQVLLQTTVCVYNYYIGI